MPETILDVIARGSGAAIETDDRPVLEYDALRDHVERTRSGLTDLGFGTGDRIAIVLPPRAELATAFVAVACTCAAVPLNPAYRRAEFAQLLPDLRVNAVLTMPTAGDAVHEAARDAGVPVLHVASRTELPAGAFEIVPITGNRQRRSGSDIPGPRDTALLLHTSGTTSRPKIVPLTHANLAAGARNVARALGLTSDDRCLAVMPLFHIHGIVASLLATLWSGGTVVGADGFSAFRFGEQLMTLRPTWTTAVPTMYQAVLSRAASTAPAHSLRMMRSSSVALSPRLMRRLEEHFETPVLEALGMTEASHQVCANPPPPGQRRAGSVGVSAGAEISILDGELLVRGPGVFDGYENNAEANAVAFVDGWFRTGDLASIADDGYVTLNGRIKELINRGGEKIGPREVEDVLLDHGAVEQAVVFPVPHEMLGEDVAAAVVLGRGSDVTERDLRAHVRERLAPFKVPRTIVIVDEIPKSATGKPQRLTMAARLQLRD